MKRFTGFTFTFVFGLMLFAANLASASTKTEAELIQKLHSSDWREVHGAMIDLMEKYPTSTAVVPLLKTMLRSNTLAANPEQIVQTQTRSGLRLTSLPASSSMPPMYLSRQAARALATYHADMSGDDLHYVYRLLEYPDVETKMDALKALRGGFKAPDAVSHIVPLLKDPNQHVVRDACRTLAVIGDKSTVPSIEPLLKSKDSEVRGDAEHAIFALNHK